MLLTVNNATTYYDYVRALHKVQLNINYGEFVTLIGANGAGKSTLLKLVLGVQSISEGDIYFEDKRIDNVSSTSIAKLGISSSPEGRRLFPQLSVYENLLMGCYAQRLDKKQVKINLDRVLTLFPAVGHRLSQIAGTMSGGEQQMVAIGRALMGDPKLLLLDEPSLGLAPLVIENLMESLSKIHKSGTSILLIEQNVNLALSLSDRAYLLANGEIVLEGDSYELKDSDKIKEVYLGSV